MKLGIEAMIFALLFGSGVLIAFNVYMTSLEISQAKQYHAFSIEKLEGAKYAKSIQEECEQEAKEQGYDLILKEEDDQKKIILKYKLFFPLQGKEKEYEIVGISHWKGGEEEL